MHPNSCLLPRLGVPTPTPMMCWAGPDESGWAEPPAAAAFLFPASAPVPSCSCVRPLHGCPALFSLPRRDTFCASLHSEVVILCPDPKGFSWLPRT
ncbi:Nonribosomal peptide synthetase lcsA [Frankliniella fusca]|uniref:Nonribosomal peptide synthetase lcsA n=1 Tax=Frankliniella fusca TaxID=407009 RepID=A0AAE1GPV2_9NEOP|nr:Nonribosomal peptide synthetase lcsA [Frankliniella fusca]